MRNRRAAVAAALALTLALPVTALAADTSGTTTESFSLAASISMTVPASITYTVDVNSTAKSQVNLTNIGTNTPAGLTITGLFSAFTGPVTIPATARLLEANKVAPTGGILAGEVKQPPVTASPVTILQRPTSVAAGGATWGLEVSPITVAGTYSGSIVFTATTN